MTSSTLSKTKFVTRLWLGSAITVLASSVQNNIWKAFIKQNSALGNLAHAIYRDFFQLKELKMSLEKMIFSIFLLKTLIVGTC